MVSALLPISLLCLAPLLSLADEHSGVISYTASGVSQDGHFRLVSGNYSRKPGESWKDALKNAGDEAKEKIGGEISKFEQVHLGGKTTDYTLEAKGLDRHELQVKENAEKQAAKEKSEKEKAAKKAAAKKAEEERKHERMKYERELQEKIDKGNIEKLDKQQDKLHKENDHDDRIQERIRERQRGEERS